MSSDYSELAYFRYDKSLLTVPMPTWMMSAISLGYGPDLITLGLWFFSIRFAGAGAGAVVPLACSNVPSLRACFGRVFHFRA